MKREVERVGEREREHTAQTLVQGYSSLVDKTNID